MSSYFIYIIFGLSQKIIYSDLLDLLRAQGHLLLFVQLFPILINVLILLDFLFSSFLVLFSLFSVLFFSFLSSLLFSWSLFLFSLFSFHSVSLQGDRMRLVVKNKEEGTELFKGGNYRPAAARYHKALSHSGIIILMW